MRRQFTLPAEDMEWLEAIGKQFELVAEAGGLRVLIHGFSIPPGYNVKEGLVNIRIEPGYPDAQIDMAYFFPALALLNRRPIRATCADPFDGKTWQRWSRHRSPANPWRPGIDNLSTHFALVQEWLERETRTT